MLYHCGLWRYQTTKPDLQRVLACSSKKNCRRMPRLLRKPKPFVRVEFISRLSKHHTQVLIKFLREGKKNTQKKHRETVVRQYAPSMLCSCPNPKMLGTCTGPICKGPDRHSTRTRPGRTHVRIRCTCTVVPHVTAFPNEQGIKKSEIEK